HADYPVDRGDGDDEPSNDDNDDDDDTYDGDEEPFEDEDDDEEEEHLAQADSSVVPIIDPVPSAGDTEAFETGESAPTPRSPHIRIPFAQICLRRVRKTVKLEPPMSTSMEARIAEYAAAPAPPSPPPSPLSPWSPPLSQIPLPLYEVGESSTAVPRPTGGHREDYGFIGTTDAEIRRWRAEEVVYSIRDVWVDPTEAVEEVAPTTLEGVNGRVTELAAVQEQDTHDVYADSYPDAGLPYRLTGVTDDNIDCTSFITTGTVVSGIGTDSTLQARDQTRADDHEGAASTNNMPPRRSSATARAAAAAAATVAAATPMTAAAIEQLIEARVSVALANHETL
ncbi:hypothetical protein Tco_1306792, partial [Tanacetum coccineum]